MERYFCISVGYCDLQNLLSREEKTGYTCGVYGWNANVYTFGNWAIVTGYRPFGTNYSYGNDAVVSYRKYEEKAKKIIHDYTEYGGRYYNMPFNKRYERAKERLHKLVLQMIDEIKNAQ